MRVNLGCGEFPLEGWVNLDAFPPEGHHEVVKADMRKAVYHDLEEVLMEHSLEHIPWPDVVPLLMRIRSWMAPGGKIHIEVPDMREIMRRGELERFWMQYIYGAQLPHEGEFHRCGFTEATLTNLLTSTGWFVQESREFLSEHPYRPGMPCLSATAVAV